MITMPELMELSYVLQAIGFVFMLFAWGKALKELVKGEKVLATRRLMFAITTVTLVAYLFPVYASYCHFADCFRSGFRDILRVTSGIILFLYGFFKFLLYYTKDNDI
jgi:hypothetical protein